MWCKHCQQDVPAIAPADEPRNAGANGSAGNETPGAAGQIARLLCARCGEPIGSDPPAALWEAAAEAGTELAAVASSQAAARSATAANVEFEAWQWELDQELHDVRRLLDRQRSDAAGPRAVPASFELPTAYELASHRQERRPAPEPQNLPRATMRVDAPVRNHASAAERPATLSGTWLLLMLGLTATVCGGVLLGWSMIADRNELWSLGVPITLGGQAALFLSLVLMLVRLGRQSQQAVARLQVVDQRLAGLDTLPSEHVISGVPHQSFYTHLAEGAQPHLLLADLKNQMDLLAIRMAHEKR